MNIDKNINKNKLIKIIKNFNSKSILVVGDIMLDKYIWGEVERISPEAPVPVVDVKKETQSLGACGNVADNIVSVGAKAYVATIVGDDTYAEELRSIMLKKGIIIEGMFSDTSRPTTVKTRIVAQNQQVVRVDKESRLHINPSVFFQIKNYIEDIKSKIDAIIISDYGKGVITKSLLKFLINLAKKLDIPITVDPKIEHFLEYKGVTTLTPNLNEAILGIRLNKKPQTEEEIYLLGRKILNKLKPEALVITRGPDGMTLFEKEKIYHIPTRAKEVYDVTGAGDTVISILTLCLASGADFVSSCEISNFAAGIVVGKVGTATVSIKELEETIRNYEI
ncbi:MAG: D-glycero-beta-D-manno-heptose-7-phosphate kinase [Endomicrobia bacterium]|nr:D-glycero-beta-D-manno-heptose-7-phosphate kinase [Endomicrobiia bacterium]